MCCRSDSGDADDDDDDDHDDVDDDEDEKNCITEILCFFGGTCVPDRVGTEIKAVGRALLETKVLYQYYYCRQEPSVRNRASVSHELWD